jgi:hypothetical protein
VDHGEDQVREVWCGHPDTTRGRFTDGVEVFFVAGVMMVAGARGPAYLPCTDRWPVVFIELRAAFGFAVPSLYDYCEQQGIDTAAGSSKPPVGSGSRRLS